MIESTAILVNRAGLHARSSAKLVDVTTSYSSSIQVGLGDRFVDGKSILALMMLAATKGCTLTLRANGDDEEAAVEAIKTLIAQGFGESD